MTDEERQRLCERLRNRDYCGFSCATAADEIERLAAEVKRWEALQEWQDPPSWIGGPTKVRAGNAVTAKALKGFK
jgi:hypothetical protein